MQGNKGLVFAIGAAALLGWAVRSSTGVVGRTKKPRTTGGLKWSTTKEKQSNYIAAHWGEMMALAPDPGSDPRSKAAFERAVADYKAKYLEQGPVQSGGWSYLLFRNEVRLSPRKTPKMNQFFNGVLGRLDDMIQYEEMRKANWRWRKSSRLWGKQGPPPIASDGDTL